MVMESLNEKRTNILETVMNNLIEGTNKDQIDNATKLLQKQQLLQGLCDKILKEIQGSMPTTKTLSTVKDKTTEKET